MSINSYLYACSSYLPDQVVRSEDLMDELKSESNFGISRTILNDVMGIKERRMIDASENKFATLSTLAAIKLFETHQIDPRSIGAIIYCGIDRDYKEPGTVHETQDNLGTNAIAFDISNACHGFSDGFFIADSFIKNGLDNILLITAEIASEVTKGALIALKKEPEKINSMFGAFTVGDGAGAALITSYPGENAFKFNQFHHGGDSSCFKLCHYNIENGVTVGQMVMDKICAKMLAEHRKLLSVSLPSLGWNKPDYVVPHQVGKKPHDKFSQMTGLALDKLSMSYDLLGNIASATMPVNLEKTLNNCNGSIKNILLMGAGSGLAISQIGLTKV